MNKQRHTGATGVTDGKRTLFGFSPWLILGVCAVLALAITVLMIRNTERERQHVVKTFMDRADALVWALESGTRTWMGFESERTLLQPLIVETARQPGIVYMMVINDQGRILAHSDADMVGKFVKPEDMPPGPPVKEAAWRVVAHGEARVCEVYREFSPIQGVRGAAGAHGYMMRPWYGAHGHEQDPSSEHMRNMPPGRRHGRFSGAREGGVPGGSEAPISIVQQESGYFALVGFDHRIFDEALAGDYSNNLMTALLVSAFGLAAFFAMFWAHNYRRSRRLLKDTQALAAAVVTSLPLGLLTSEPDGAVGMINAAALDMLGLERAQVIGRPLRELPGLDWAVLAASLASAGKLGEREASLHVAAEGRDQENGLPVSLSASQILGDDCLFLGQVFILRDIAEVKKLQAEIRRNERLSALGNLAAGVAHEIRNPLSSIKGLATYLSQKVPPEGQEAEAAKTMIQEVNRLNRVVSELLDFARPGPLKLAEADLNQIISRALRLAEADIQAAGVTVHFAPNLAFSAVRVNTERLTQALLNLFLNAAQAMRDKEGGRLDVFAGFGPEKDTFSISVKDNGQGMPESILASIFTPYFTTKSAGTGLGLAIVHQIVESHGGRILVKSAPGQGSLFQMILPLGAAA